jgi:hypothetical protein
VGTAVAVLAAAVVLTLLRRSGAGDGTVLRGGAAWVATAAVGVPALALLAYGLVRPATGRYPGDSGRDLRIDMVRGLAVVLVVLNQVGMPSLFHLASQEAVGPVSGAELFVTLSGVVLGVAHRGRAGRSGLAAAVGSLWSRAFRLYRTALVVVLGVFALTLLPGVDGRVVTTFPDPAGPGPFDLYPNIHRLLDYPVPGFVLRDILLLRLGPSQLNVMGLYVVLLLLAPLAVAALRHRLPLLLLAVSTGLYVLDAVRPTVPLATQFQDPFPLLTWQLLFVLGMTAGWYRARLLAWAGTGVGRAVVALAVLGHLGMLFLAWNNPVLSNAYDVRLALVPEATSTAVYDTWFGRADLEPGRLLDVVLLLVTLYALLTVYWRPLERALGWFLVPLGQATLYVFVLHVFFALAVANVPGLGPDTVLLNTLGHAVTLGVLWLMVRREVLFRLVPR